jgi:hypothetical protein
MKLDRETLLDIVDKALAAAEFPAEAAEHVHDVVAAAPRCARGDFVAYDADGNRLCGCPMTMAGYVDDYGNTADAAFYAGVPEDAVGKFIEIYDAETSRVGDWSDDKPIVVEVTA